jgi:alcohol dehydrogenase YqhD (iron-dependent ADH family)
VKSFEFATAGRIVFGSGAFDQLEAIAAAFGSRPFLVTGGQKPQASQVNQPSSSSAKV